MGMFRICNELHNSFTNWTNCDSIDPPWLIFFDSMIGAGLYRPLFEG